MQAGHTHIRHILPPVIFQEAAKEGPPRSLGGAPRTLCIPLKGAPGTVLESDSDKKTLPGKLPLKTTRARTPQTEPVKPKTKQKWTLAKRTLRASQISSGAPQPPKTGPQNEVPKDYWHSNVAIYES